MRQNRESWRVNPQGLNIGLSKGAGQYRAIGRTVAIWGADRIRQQLNRNLTRLGGAQVNEELGKLFGKVTGETPEGEPPLRIVVVSSLAGGSGAGLLTDVCDIIRALSPNEGSEIFGVLYTPEVFQALGADATGGVQPNTLAAISEVLNGHWYGGDPLYDSTTISATTVPQIQDKVLQSIGLAESLERSGPAYPS